MNTIETGEVPAPAPRERDDEGEALLGEARIPNVAQQKTVSLSWKGILAVALLVLTLFVASGVAIHRVLTSNRSPADMTGVADRPAAAGGEPKALDLSLPAKPAASSPLAPMIPAIVPSRDELPAEPIGVRRTGTGGTSGPRHASPEDAPAMLVTGRAGATSAASPDAEVSAPFEETRRSLESYQRQLQSLLDSMSKRVSGSGAVSAAPVTPSRRQPGTADRARAHLGTAERGDRGGLFGGELQASSTPRTSASTTGNRSLVLPKGSAFTCALTTRVVSATSGLVGCQVQRNVYSENGRVLLIERGSHIDGEYRSTSVHPGTVRIPVLWTRIRTPLGITMDVDSPGTGALGESGIDGYVDNRWMERIGGALLLSFVDDAVALAAQRSSGSTDNGGGTTIVMPSTTGSSSKLAEKLLDGSINLPPLIYQDQGAVVGIYVARDVDFSRVYELQVAGSIAP